MNKIFTHHAFIFFLSCLLSFIHAFLHGFVHHYCTINMVSELKSSGSHWHPSSIYYFSIVLHFFSLPTSSTIDSTSSKNTFVVLDPFLFQWFTRTTMITQPIPQILSISILMKTRHSILWLHYSMTRIIIVGQDRCISHWFPRTNKSSLMAP